MNRIISTIIFLTLFSISFSACNNKHEIIDENVQNVLMDFISENDFAGFVRFEDGLDTIKTCLSATLYDIDTNHYMTLIISRFPDDAFIGTPCYHLNRKPPMYYKVGDKDLFVYSHTNSTYSLFPQNTCSEKTVFEKEKAYTPDEKMIDCEFVIQTYKYRLGDKEVWIEKDSIFDFFQWLYPDMAEDIASNNNSGTKQ